MKLAQPPMAYPTLSAAVIPGRSLRSQLVVTIVSCNKFSPDANAMQLGYGFCIVPGKLSCRYSMIEQGMLTSKAREGVPIM
jgi:hypothetical protein